MLTFFLCASQIALNTTRPRSRLYPDNPRPDAPVIYTGAFPVLTAWPGSICYTISVDICTTYMHFHHHLSDVETRVVLRLKGQSILVITPTREKWRTHKKPSKTKVYSVLITLWTPSNVREKAGRPTRIYIQQLKADKRCSLEDLPGAMGDRDGWRERVKEILAGGSALWWWHILVFIKKR